jgi:hypothetical protein
VEDHAVTFAAKTDAERAQIVQYLVQIADLIAEMTSLCSASSLPVHARASVVSRRKQP